MTTVPPLRHTGDSMNIASYRAPGWWVEVIRNLPRKDPEGGRTGHGDFGGRVYRTDDQGRPREPYGQPYATFRYEPRTEPAPGPLSGRWVTRLTRQAVAELAAHGIGGEQ